MTRLFAVIGDGRVAKSLSPAMHNAALTAHGIDGLYLALAVEPARVGEAVAGIRGLGLAGVNVTVPHKQAVIPHLDALDPLALRLGAVNTIVNQAGVLTGHNTDLPGLLWALKRAGVEPAGRRCLVVGAGGAARAVVLGLNQAGAAGVTIAARRVEQARALAAELGGEGVALAECAPIAAQAALIVNASAVSDPAEGPDLARLAAGWNLAACRLVLDINYGRRVNLWRQLARHAGAAFVDGRPMLAAQAAHSFALWTGLNPDPAAFLAALPAPPAE
ncbi:MAG: shikimate dehydrogenase [Pseudomonadota bacterium]